MSPAHMDVSVTIDTAADQHPISPYIYGMAFAPDGYQRDLHLGANRWGGNDKSRYNWVQGNACNAARDWRWANRPAANGGIAAGPSSAADNFIANNRAAGTATVLTVPTIGWVARDADNATTSLNVPGNGGAPLTTADGAIEGYDPTLNRRRTSVPSFARRTSTLLRREHSPDAAVYQDEWIQHLVRKFGDTNRGGVRFYAMDNEPDLWDNTHTDIHPARMGYDDVLAKFVEYSSAVKYADPTAEVTGPVVSGWTGLLYSALDRGADNFHTHADCTNHNGDAFLLWFLKRLRAHDAISGKRSLDVLDVHYYPQGQGIFAGITDTDTNARRVRATQSLWDPHYVDESWIGEPVRLIPRLKEWIAAGYPGTKIGITEWNFGGDTNMSGAIAIAEALGTFGKEGVYLANYWAYPTKGSPGYLAFQLFRNADGNSHGFGNVSCHASCANPRGVSCFAATEASTGHLTIILINKMAQTTVTASILLKGHTSANIPTKVWLLSSDHLKIVAPQTASNVRNGVSIASLPPYSVTLIEVSSRLAAR